MKGKIVARGLRDHSRWGWVVSFRGLSVSFTGLDSSGCNIGHGVGSFMGLVSIVHG